jgi:hypothetical protein
MANIVNSINRVADIILDGSTDWVGQKRPVHSIEYMPGGVADEFIVRACGTTGPIVFQVESANKSDFFIKYFDGFLKDRLVVKASEIAVSEGHRLIITYAD